MEDPDELVQIAERALADAEDMLRVAPAEANQRRVMSAWSFVREAPEAADRKDEAPGQPPGSLK